MERGTAYFVNEDRIFSGEGKIELYYKLLSYSNPYKKEGKNAPCGIGAPWGKIFRTSFLRKNNIIFDLQLRWAQDIIFNLYAVAKARQVRYINVPLYNYNYNYLGTMHLKYNPKLYEFYIRFAKARYEWYKDCINLLNERERDIYYLGTFFNILFCLKNGPLHPLYDGSKKQLLADCNKLMELDCFSWTQTNRRKIKLKVTFRNKLVQFFVRHRLWLALHYILSEKSLLSK